MTLIERILAALYVSEIWYSGHRDEKASPKFRNFCRAKAVVLFDRIITERVRVDLA